jgi:two-component system phosphate regulon sensor histidine kinase PhoR
MRWRIASAYIVLLVSTLVLLSAVMLQIVRSAYVTTLEAGIAGQARLVATIAERQNLMASAAEREAVIAALHNQLGARVTLIAPNGAVLADAPQEAGATQNLSARPEVRDALTGREGASARASIATGEDTFYVAVPVGAQRAPSGVVRIGVPLTTIAQTQSRLAVAVVSTAIAAALLALVLAILIARRTTQPLLELRGMAGRLASGDLSVQVTVPDDYEVAALAQEFNQMASRLRELVAAVDTERVRLTTVLTAMADGILMIDGDDTITLINPSAERMLALSAAELPRPLASLPNGGTLLLHVQQARAHTETEMVRNLEISIHPTQYLLRACVTLMPTQQEQVLIVLQDLTELRQIEYARRMALANISHDLRTPLTTLQAIIETLQDGALDDHDAAWVFLGRMDAEVQGLNQLVREFLELTQIESGQLAVQPAVFNIEELLTHLTNRMQTQACQRGVSITLALPASLPPVTADAARIEQVCLNLLQNALTFTLPGGQITIGAELQSPWLQIWVRDTGIGISAEDVPHIFERFYKADRARSRTGSGLGLSIVKYLVERHGGVVSAQSQPGAGTTISFTLPLAPPSSIER